MLRENETLGLMLNPERYHLAIYGECAVDSTRSKSTFDTRTYGDIVIGIAARAEALTPVGVAAAQFTLAQRARRRAR